MDTPASRYDIAGLLADLGDVPVVTEMGVVRRKSRDFFWYSPILNKQLHGLSADIIVEPRDDADVVRTLAACFKRRIPVTPRGGATGNYGQAVPLQGGVLMDMGRLTKVELIRPGIARLGAGGRMDHIDAALRPHGWELRQHPSTKRMASIGGFVAGGGGGVGSVTWGGLRDGGNIIGARVVTMEEQPRVLELRGDAAQKINRAYGTTGIITEVELPLAPTWPWVDVIVAFDDFFQALAAGQELALADGIVKKLVSPITWPIPSYFRDLAAWCPHGKSIVICMIAEPSLESFRALMAAKGGIVTHERPFDESPGKEPLYEYTWNHTTLQILKVDRSITYLQCLWPFDRLIETTRRMHDLLGDECLHHLEFLKFGGRLTASSLPIVRYTTPERLNEIIALHEANGVSIANPHVYTLEEGSRHKRIEADQLGFKHEVDPLGLLNPGKMRDFVPRTGASA
jgi:FAD/FMN-containing dehydrogenase